MFAKVQRIEKKWNRNKDNSCRFYSNLFNSCPLLTKVHLNSAALVTEVYSKKVYRKSRLRICRERKKQPIT